MVQRNSWLDLPKHGLTTIGQTVSWDWFVYHFSQRPPHPLAKSIVDACADCEVKLPGLGSQFLRDLASISAREKHLPDYEQLMQKLGEVLVLRQLLTMEWHEGTPLFSDPFLTPLTEQ